MRKFFSIIFGIIFYILFFHGGVFATPDEVDISGISVPGWTIKTGRGIDDASNHIVFWGDGPKGEKNHSVFHDITTQEVVDLGIDDITQEPLLAWGINSNGTVVCGFDKVNGNSWMWQPGIGFTTVVSDVTDYDVIHASDVNTAKTLVGYLECTNYPTCSGVQGFYKKNNGNITPYQYSGGYDTEFYSINNPGVALGRTSVNGGECIFEYNTNNNEVTDISGTCDSFSELKLPDIFNITTAYADDLLPEPGIPYGVDHSHIHLNDYSEICYSYKGKIYIWNTKTDEVEEIIFPGYEDDDLNIGGFSSGGTMIVNVDGKESFIAKRISNIPFDLNLSWVNYFYFDDSFWFNLKTIPFNIDVSNGDIIPIKIKIEIGGVLDKGNFTNHEFNGYVEIKQSPYGIYFDFIEE